MTTAFFTTGEIENAIYDDVFEAMTHAVAVDGFVCVGKDDAARILRDHAIAEAAREWAEKRRAGEMTYTNLCDVTLFEIVEANK